MSKESLLEMVGKMEFMESYEMVGKCPECGGKVIRHVRRETQQSWGGRWYVEYCEEKGCNYIDTGFTSKSYNPKNARRYKVE